MQFISGTKNVNGKGYILQRLYNLRLSDEEDNLSAVIKVVKTVEAECPEWRGNC